MYFSHGGLVCRGFYFYFYQCIEECMFGNHLFSVYTTTLKDVKIKIFNNDKSMIVLSNLLTDNMGKVFFLQVWASNWILV